MKYLKPTKVLFTTFAGCALASLLVACARAQSSPQNIALGKTVTFNEQPNYPHCSDPDDDKQLTDGKYGSGDSRLWMQRGTVGWTGRINPAIITIDLGSVQPISGVSYSTVAGGSGTVWPSSIYIATSDDGKTWHYAGDLMQMLEKNPPPPERGYLTFHLATHQLKTKGRYIAFGVVQLPWKFVDEIEVYKGDSAWLSQPTPGRTASGLDEMIRTAISTAYAQRRLNDDIAEIRRQVNDAPLSASRKSTFISRLAKDAAAVQKIQPVPVDIKTILPLNDIHRDILAVHGELLAAGGKPALTVWHQHRYAWLPLLANPNTINKLQLSFSMLGNQFRSDNLLLTNASGRPLHITLQLNSPPPGAQDGWLQVSSAIWTDTMQGTAVADALFLLTPQNGIYQVTVPAGMTGRIWMTVDSSKVLPGTYKSSFTVRGAGRQTRVPLQLNVSPLAMATPRYSMGVWDYTNQPNRGITLKNRDAAIALMRSHYVDTPWGTEAVLPRPGADAFDAQGNLKHKLDFSNLDQWVSMWPGAKNYFVYFSAKQSNSFAGAKMNTPEFSARLSAWAKAVAVHMRELKLKPSQLGLELVDEPHDDQQAAVIAAWAKAIHAGAPELTLFVNPTWPRPDQIATQDAITQNKVICPQFPIYKRGGEPVQKYFQSLRQQGRQLWFYQATGPVRLYDPQGYYRYQAWQSFALGASGQCFWGFAATSGAPSSWNEYAMSTPSYAPEFIDGGTVYNTVHWDAAREGIEDNEELAMLNDAIQKSNDHAWKMHATEVLNNAVKTITSTWKDDYDWTKATNPNLADVQIQKVQALLK